MKKVEVIDRILEDQNVKIARLRTENKRLQDKVNETDFQCRLNNLQFIGLPEKKNENTEQLITNTLGRLGIDLEKTDIVRAFRLGNTNPTEPDLCW